MNRIFLYFLTMPLFLASCRSNESETAEDMFNENTSNYVQNRSPLQPKPYLELPLGSITPKGWLKEQLVRMKKGLTGSLDEAYPSVVGSRNGWLGGDGDGWERGPYWLDGLVPLAYILDDDSLKAKARPWIEWTLKNQAESGYFGPIPFENAPGPEPGLQKDRRRDWWPKMVMLKVLMQYYDATGDQRVIDLMTNYFKYQLKELPQTPLDNWSFWANRRGGDNLLAVYWLYNRTGDSFLIDLAQLLHQQTFPYTQVFHQQVFDRQADLAHLYPYNTSNKYPFDPALIKRLSINQMQSFHCVNIAQGIKAPVIYYQQSKDSIHVKAVKKALRDLNIFHGQPQGMYGGDEPLHGARPTQGVEFCSVVELMYSLENMNTILGDVEMMDHLEKIAYNALPAQASDDFNYRQYFQSANQVLLTRARRNSYEEDNHFGTDMVFGLLTGYPCCTCNMHQGWPKFTQNLYYATLDGGVAAFQYAASEVNMVVADQQKLQLKQITDYPFDENIIFKFSLDQPASFPFHLRIPGWATNPEVQVNGESVEQKPEKGTVFILERIWNDGDEITLNLPMKLNFSRWFENSIAVEYGPLVYSLKIDEDWRLVENKDKYQDFYEVYPDSPWNYGLLQSALDNPEENFEVIKRKLTGYPWSFENAPVILKTRAKQIPEWTLYNQMPGPLPHSRPQRHLADKQADQIVLIPYGCSVLRITEFPVVE